MLAAMAKRDYYEVLGVSRDSSPDAIKKAYYKLARRYHPDANNGDENTEAIFKEAAEAYEVLGDPEKKAKYDRFGHSAFDGQQGFGGFDFGGGGISDIFDMFFGGAGRQRRGPEKGADIRVDLEFTLHEAAFGIEKDVKVPRIEECGTCGGSGASPGTSSKTCDTCGGAGQVQYAQSTPFGRMVQTRACDRCRGTGKIIEKPCATCHGAGQVRRNKNIHIKVPPGVDNGTRLRVTGEGEAGLRGGPRGDLYAFMHVKPHKDFARDGNDLISEIPISFTQAALGDELEVSTLDGKASIRIPEGTQTGTVFRLRGKGVPDVNGYGRGDLHIRVKVTTPSKLSESQRELLLELAKLGGEKVQGVEKGFFGKVKEALKG